MSIAAIYRVKDIIKLDYPFSYSLESLLPLCDEICIGALKSSDDTMQIVLDLQKKHGKDRIKFIEADLALDRAWQEKIADLTIKLTTAEWRFFIDADECIHENEIELIKQNMQHVRLVSFNMLHFYAQENFVASTDHFYKRHTRMGKGDQETNLHIVNLKKDNNDKCCSEMCATVNGKLISAHSATGDFVSRSSAHIFHYGWMRDPKVMLAKIKRLNAWYQNEPDQAEKAISISTPFDYQLSKQILDNKVSRFMGTHPAAIEPWLIEKRKTYLVEEHE